MAHDSSPIGPAVSEVQARLLVALEALATVLRSSAAPSMIIGGIAVIAHGVPRLTLDIDATVWASAIDLDVFIARLAEHGIRPRIEDAEQFARRHQILLLAHEPSGTPLDVSLAWLPFEEHALTRARQIDFQGIAVLIGVDRWIPEIERIEPVDPAAAAFNSGRA